jgi:hypothetical protein
MGFVFSVDPDVIPAHSALAIEKGAGMPPRVGDFDLLEKSYVRQFRHKAVLGKTANRIANKPAKCKQTKNAHDRAAF